MHICNPFPHVLFLLHIKLQNFLLINTALLSYQENYKLFGDKILAISCIFLTNLYKNRKETEPCVIINSVSFLPSVISISDTYYSSFDSFFFLTYITAPKAISIIQIPIIMMIVLFHAYLEMLPSVFGAGMVSSALLSA